MVPWIGLYFIFVHITGEYYIDNSLLVAEKKRYLVNFIILLIFSCVLSAGADYGNSGSKEGKISKETGKHDLVT
jgi:hypothetical protein